MIALTPRPAGPSRRLVFYLAALLVGFGLSLLGWAAWPQSVQAAAEPQAPDTACKLCHVDSPATYTLPSGESFPVQVDLSVLDSSIHGLHNLAAGDGTDIYCTDCHRSRDRYLYPHQPNPAQTYDQFQADVGNNCAQCHVPLERHNPGHVQAMKSRDEAGRSALPTCSDCHGGHDAAPLTSLEADPIAFCQGCHTELGETPEIQKLHATVVPKLDVAAGETCQTCHADEPFATEDGSCKTCHGLLEDVTTTLPSGEQLPLNIHIEDVESSVHGARTIEGVDYPALGCTDCHGTQRYAYPHLRLPVKDARDYTIAKEVVCNQCHEGIVETNHTSVHARAIAEGNKHAASCVDCHGAHRIQDPDVPRGRISQTCAQCHSTINDMYKSSVHGAALLEEDNPDVPVCSDCHGNHDITDPTTAKFRLQSPELCARCHADDALMTKYGISTEVFETYVADFHGTTVTVFNKTSPDQEVNTAVCYDCHGVHDIQTVTEANSHVLKANLLNTCRQCHPDAVEGFPDSWMSHFQPSLAHYPAVYLVNLFYQILIPAIVGGFALFIGSDVVRRTVDRRRSKKDAAKDQQA